MAINLLFLQSPRIFLSVQAARPCLCYEIVKGLQNCRQLPRTVPVLGGLFSEDGVLDSGIYDLTFPGPAPLRKRRWLGSQTRFPRRREHPPRHSQSGLLDRALRPLQDAGRGAPKAAGAPPAPPTIPGARPRAPDPGVTEVLRQASAVFRRGRESGERALASAPPLPNAGFGHFRRGALRQVPQSPVGNGCRPAGGAADQARPGRRAAGSQSGFWDADFRAGSGSGGGGSLSWKPESKPWRFTLSRSRVLRCNATQVRGRKGPETHGLIVGKGIVRSWSLFLF
nr:translation initiation factor IF-2-like [Pongo abelii]